MNGIEWTRRRTCRSRGQGAAVPIRRAWSRHRKRAFGALGVGAHDGRRRIDRAEHPLLDHPESFRLQLRREIDHIVLGEPCQIEWRRLGRNRLRRRGVLTRNGRLWNRPLFDRPHGLTGHPVEHEYPRQLAGLDDRLDSLPVDRDIRKRGAQRIHVPQIVVGQLKVPDALPGLRVEANGNAVGEEILTGPLSAAKRVVRRRQRQIDYPRVSSTAIGPQAPMSPDVFQESSPHVSLPIRPDAAAHETSSGGRPSGRRIP